MSSHTDRTDQTCQEIKRFLYLGQRRSEGVSRAQLAAVDLLSKCNTLRSQTLSSHHPPSPPPTLQGFEVEMHGK